MNSSDVKISLFRKIDMLQDDELERVHGELMNILNGVVDSTHWKSLSQKQQQGLKDAKNSLDLGLGIAHEEVLEKYRKRYSNG